MYITNNKYRIAQLKPQHIEVSSKILADIFLNHNKTWSTIAPTLEEAHRFMKEKTSELIDWQNQLRENGTIPKDAFMNFIYLDEKDNIVCVGTAADLTMFLSRKSRAVLKEFDILESYGHVLQKSIHPRDIVPGKSVYGVFIAMKDEVMGKGLAMLFWLDVCHYFYSIGYRNIFARTSNTITYTLMARYGAEITARIKPIENGKQLSLQFIKWPLSPISYIQHLSDVIVRKAKL